MRMVGKTIPQRNNVLLRWPVVPASARLSDCVVSSAVAIMIFLRGLEPAPAHAPCYSLEQVLQLVSRRVHGILRRGTSGDRVTQMSPHDFYELGLLGDAGETLAGCDQVFDLCHPGESCDVVGVVVWRFLRSDATAERAPHGDLWRFHPLQK